MKSIRFQCWLRHPHISVSTLKWNIHRFLPPLALAAALVFPLSVWATEMNVETATIRDLQAAFQKGTLTSEKLTRIYLGRIAAYDKHGPAINAIITLNPNALVEARALDSERKAGKVRGPLHGIPIVLKDNFNTFDMPTTAGSQLLEGSIPPADGFLTKKLRDAGAIIIAKGQSQRIRRWRWKHRRSNRSGNTEGGYHPKWLQFHGRSNS